MAEPGTEAWARQELLLSFPDPADQQVITNVVAGGLVPYPSAWRARVHYAQVCGERRWSAWQARLAWAIIEAFLKDPMDDDIPF